MCALTKSARLLASGILANPKSTSQQANAAAAAAKQLDTTPIVDYFGFDALRNARFYGHACQRIFTKLWA